MKMKWYPCYLLKSKLEGVVKSQSEFKLKQIMKNIAGMESEIQKLEKQVFDLENNAETKKIKNKFFTLGLM
jgi:peptidoglycan hydrolase CwlO-like protein